MALHRCRKPVQLLTVHAQNGGIFITFSHPGCQSDHGRNSRQDPHSCVQRSCGNGFLQGHIQLPASAVKSGIPGKQNRYLKGILLCCDPFFL